MRGVTVQLKVNTQSGADDFNRPTFTSEYIDVDNVLVGSPTADDINNNYTRYGKRTAYTLAIPKDDENTWIDTDVILPAPFAGTYHTIGYPIAAIESNIPPGIPWNMQISVERIGDGDA